MEFGELPQDVDFYNNAPMSARRETSLLENIRLDNVLKIKETRDEFYKYVTKQRNSEPFELIETVQTMDSKRRDIIYKLENNRGNTTPTSGNRTPGSGRASSIYHTTVTEVEWVQLKDLMDMIANTFIKENSKKEIALEPKIRNTLLQQIQGPSNLNEQVVAPKALLLAKYEYLLHVDLSRVVSIATMQLQQDSFHAFLQSSEFHQLLHKFKTEEEKAALGKLLTAPTVFQPTSLLWSQEENTTPFSPENSISTPTNTINHTPTKHQSVRSRNSLFLNGSPLLQQSPHKLGWDQHLSLSSFLYSDKMLKEEPFITEREFQWLHYIMEEHSFWNAYVESDRMDECSIFTSPLQFLTQSKGTWSQTVSKYGLIKLEIYLPYHYDTVARAMMLSNFQQDYFCSSMSEIKDILQGMPMLNNTSTYDESILHHVIFGLDRKCHTLLKQAQYNFGSGKRQCQIATSIKLMSHLDRMYFIRKSCKAGSQQSSSSIWQKKGKFAGLNGISLSKVGEHETKLTQIIYANIGNVSHPKQMSSGLVSCLKKASQEFFDFYMDQLKPIVKVTLNAEEDAPSELEEQLQMNVMDEQYKRQFECMEWNFHNNGRQVEQQVYQENPKLYYPSKAQQLPYQFSKISVSL